MIEIDALVLRSSPIFHNFHLCTHVSVTSINQSNIMTFMFKFSGHTNTFPFKTPQQCFRNKTLDHTHTLQCHNYIILLSSHLHASDITFARSVENNQRRNNGRNLSTGPKQHPFAGALHALSPDILIFYAPKTALKVIYLIPCCFLVRVKVWNARATTGARTEWSVATPASVGMQHAAPKRHERWTGVALCRTDRRRDFLRTQRDPRGYC